MSFIVEDDVGMNDSIEIIDDTLEASIDATLQRLAAEVERNQQAKEAKRREFHTRRETERVHGRRTLQNADPRESHVAAEAAEHFARRNRLGILDRIQPRSGSSEGQGGLPESLRVTHHCPVINCGLGFTDDRKLKRHIRRAQHSPCQPCRHLPNGQIVCDQLAYLCPVCGMLYNSSAECLEHMNRNDHNVFMEPLRLGGYICPQCLQVFPSRKICEEHLKAYSHWSYSFPFADDKGRAEPLKVPVKFIEKLQEACSTVTWMLQCITCDVVVEQAQGREHVDFDHILSAESDQAAEDVFLNFLKGYTCIQCLRLFHDGTAVDTIHDCGGTVKGLIIENDCSTFQEYLRRICLPVGDNDIQEIAEDVEMDDVEIIIQHLRDTSGSAAQQAKRRVSVIGPPQVKRKRDASPDELSRRASLLTLDEGQQVPIEISQTAGQASNDAAQPVRKRTSPQPVNATSGLASPKRGSPGARGQSHDPIHVVVLDDDDDDDDDDDEPEESQNEVVEIVEDASSRTPDSQNASSSTSTGSQKKTTPKSTSSSPSSTASVQSTSSSSSTANTTAITTVNSPSTVAASSPVDENNNTVEKRQDSISRWNVQPQNPANRSPFRTCNNNGPPHYFNNLPGGAHWGRPLPPSGPYRTWLAQPRINFTNMTSSSLYNFSADQYVMPPPSHRHRHLGKPFRDRSPARFPNRDHEPNNLHTMKHIIFLDLDNWPSFFKRLPDTLPEGTFVWGFFGGALLWSEPFSDRNFNHLKRRGGFYLHPKCGRTKDAADFALVITVGRLDEKLPKNIPFSILSGDKGFIEVERQMSSSDRKTVVINPHHKSEEMLFKQLISVGNH